MAIFKPWSGFFSSHCTEGSYSPCHPSPIATAQRWAQVLLLPGVPASIPHCYEIYWGMKISQNRKGKLQMRQRLVIELSYFRLFFKKSNNIIQSNWFMCRGPASAFCILNSAQNKKKGSSWEAILGAASAHVTVFIRGRSHRSWTVLRSGFASHLEQEDLEVTSLCWHQMQLETFWGVVFLTSTLFVLAWHLIQSLNWPGCRL